MSDTLTSAQIEAELQSLEASLAEIKSQRNSIALRMVNDLNNADLVAAYNDLKPRSVGLILKIRQVKTDLAETRRAELLQQYEAELKASAQVADKIAEYESKIGRAVRLAEDIRDERNTFQQENATIRTRWRKTQDRLTGEFHIPPAELDEIAKPYMR